MATVLLKAGAKPMRILEQLGRPRAPGGRIRTLSSIRNLSSKLNSEWQGNPTKGVTDVDKRIDVQLNFGAFMEVYVLNAVEVKVIPDQDEI